MSELDDCQATMSLRSFNDRLKLFDNVLWRLIRVHASVSSLLRVPHVCGTIAEHQNPSLSFTPELVLEARHEQSEIRSDSRASRDAHIED